MPTTITVVPDPLSRRSMTLAQRRLRGYQPIKQGRRGDAQGLSASASMALRCPAIQSSTISRKACGFPPVPADSRPVRRPGRRGARRQGSRSAPRRSRTPGRRVSRGAIAWTCSSTPSEDDPPWRPSDTTEMVTSAYQGFMRRSAGSDSSRLAADARQAQGLLLGQMVEEVSSGGSMPLDWLSWRAAMSVAMVTGSSNQMSSALARALVSTGGASPALAATCAPSRTGRWWSGRRSPPRPAAGLGRLAVRARRPPTQSRVASPLAHGAIEGRASALHGAPDHTTAGRGEAGLVLATIGDEAVLEVAQRAVRRRIVPKRRSPGHDRLIEHARTAATRAASFGRLIAPAGRAARRRPGAAPRRRRCCRGPRRSAGRATGSWRLVVARRTRAPDGRRGTRGPAARGRSRESGDGRPGPRGDQVHVAEAAGVEVGDGAPASVSNTTWACLGSAGAARAKAAGAPDRRRRRSRSARSCPGAWSATRRGPAAPGCTCRAASALDPRTGQALDEALRQGNRRSARRASTRDSRAPARRGLQSAPDGFDLGKFGHRPCLAEDGGARHAGVGSGAVRPGLWT